MDNAANLLKLNCFRKDDATDDPEPVVENNEASEGDNESESAV